MIYYIAAENRKMARTSSSEETLEEMGIQYCGFRMLKLLWGLTALGMDGQSASLSTGLSKPQSWNRCKSPLL